MNDNISQHSFTQSQIESIAFHLDRIYNCLSHLVSKRNREGISIDLSIKNPNVNSPLEYIHLNDEYIAVQYQDCILLELNRTRTYLEDTIYNHPEVGFELLLNWQGIKEGIRFKIKNHKMENCQINNFLANFTF